MIKKTINVIYDMKHAPITYDFITFLAWCESMRKILGGEELLLTIKANEYRSYTKKDIDIPRDEKDWRVKSIILDACELLPSIITKNLLQSDLPVNPKNYHLPIGYEDILKNKFGYPYHMRSLMKIYRQYKHCPKVLKAPKHAQQLVRVWTQLIQHFIAKSWSIARKFLAVFSKRVANRRISFILQKNRSTMFLCA